MFYQNKHFGTAEYFIKEYGENFSFPVHLHNSFEFITIISGEMTVRIDDDSYTLKSGESLLVLPNQLHSLQSGRSKHMLCIFSPELVKAYYSKIRKKLPVKNVILTDGFLVKSLDNLLPDSSMLEKKGVLYSLCAQFDKKTKYADKIKVYDDLLYKIFSFVEQNCTTECSLIKLSAETGYSYSYLSRCFKKSTGISFNAYVNQCRISNSCYLLYNTNYSVLQCALDSGYKSLRSFNRNFVEIVGVTPSEYRANKQSFTE